MLTLKFLYDNPIGSLILGWKKRRMGDILLPAEEEPTVLGDPFRWDYVRCIPQAQIFKGVLLQGYLVPPDVLCGLENMEIRDDDVFVITYPKSGTTWTEEILSLIYNDGDVKRVQKELLAYRVHHLEVGRPLGHLRYLRKLKSPRLMATHLPLGLLPKMLRRPKCKIIYVVRNPKDTAVSYYHHHKMSTFLGNYSGTWDEFLAHFMAGHLVYGSWFDHVLQYWNFCQQHPDKVFFISYEELKMDLRSMVSNLCSFLGRNIKEECLDAICKHCSFEEMKTNRMVNRENLPIADLFDMSKSKFMRKGIIGDWRNHFSPEQSEAFDNFYEKKMAESELSLVFTPEAAMERMLTYGRIIYNHPEVPEGGVNAEEFDWEDQPSDDELDKYLHDRSSTWSRIIPSMQVHIHPDPLMIDY